MAPTNFAFKELLKMTDLVIESEVYCIIKKKKRFVLPTGIKIEVILFMLRVLNVLASPLTFPAL